MNFVDGRLKLLLRGSSVKQTRDSRGGRGSSPAKFYQTLVSLIDMVNGLFPFGDSQVITSSSVVGRVG